MLSVRRVTQRNGPATQSTREILGEKSTLAHTVFGRTALVMFVLETVYSQEALSSIATLHFQVWAGRPQYAVSGSLQCSSYNA